MCMRVLDVLRMLVDLVNVVDIDTQVTVEAHVKVVAVLDALSGPRVLVVASVPSASGLGKLAGAEDEIERAEGSNSTCAFADVASGLDSSPTLFTVRSRVSAKVQSCWCSTGLGAGLII